MNVFVERRCKAEDPPIRKWRKNDRFMSNHGDMRQLCARAAMLLIPVAKHRPTGKLVGPREVVRGAACVCLECDAPLIARQGPAVSWHFAHAADHDGGSGSCSEGSIHKAAKDVFFDSVGRWMKLPRIMPEQPLLRISSVRKEVSLSRTDRRIDLLAVFDAKRIKVGSVVTNEIVASAPYELGIEINVSHQKDAAFVHDLRVAKQHCIDIAASALWERVERGFHVRAALRGMLLNSANSYSRWLWPPVSKFVRILGMRR